MPSTILVTGVAGFIGFHTAYHLLSKGYTVVGVDNLNDYYSVQIKSDRLNQLKQFTNFVFHKADIDNAIGLSECLAPYSIDCLIHLAAQAGVRYSIENPQAYGRSNLMGFLNILEWARSHPVEHFIYASSSSVYGNSEHVPFSATANADRPISLYAATKRANELMAESYSHLFGIPATGLRFFTVYGPYGRPDMAPMKFAKQIMLGGQIDVYNHGQLSRDFTFIDDIVEGILRLLHKPPETNQTASRHRVFNIGRGEPVNLLKFIEILEQAFDKPVKKRYLPMQDGDVSTTWADVSELRAVTGYSPQVGIEEGVRTFAHWYKKYYADGQST
ncbi:GDP-mannose 4,6-dehydratase [Idiomarina loihiensis]|uniref:GDP-mannose 4,6-dehydratase n=1 Tax=Idiomarina TaxID=135575 RepID=UPI000E92588D|nr:GDP-mannose 4,6-dehydratase [Idiomarina sp.]HAS23783.1 protein CapI [Idiomarina loihiensis]